MTDRDFENEEKLNRLLANELSAGPIPAKVQEGLDAVYASLGSIPQDRPAAQVDQVPAASPRAGRTIKRGIVIVAAAALAVLLCGSAFAASRLLQMGPGDVDFFGSGENLPVYNSLEAGVSSMNAQVGEAATVSDTTVTLDSVSCDRSVVNLFLTVEKEGGIDLASMSFYEGSQENDWSRLQMVAPRGTYSITSNGQEVASGSVYLLDAYMEDGAMKVMQRIVPEQVLPDQVEVSVSYSLWWHDEALATDPISLTLGTGLDLSTVEAPRELESQDIVFPTSQGDKTLGIKRFTVSELGCVMVVRNDNVWTGEPGAYGSSYGPSAGTLSPDRVKVTDDKGNVLVAVGAGDGTGHNPEGPTIIEFANIDPDAQSVTFTPMLSVDWEALSVDERNALLDANEQHVDITQIGAQLPTCEYGGYELVGWDVADRTVTIVLRPYGWTGTDGNIRLMPSGPVALLEDTWTDPATGETGTGQHVAVTWNKHDYQAGEIMQITSYYAATDDELKNMTDYKYPSMFGMNQEDVAASQTIPFA